MLMIVVIVMMMVMVMVMMMMSRMMGAANDCADDCIKTAISLCLWCLYYTIYIHFILLIIIIIIHLSLLIIVFTGSHNRICHFCSNTIIQNYFLRGDFILQKDRLKSLITVRNQSFNILLNLIWGPHCLWYITTNTEKNTAGKSASGQLALAYLVMMMN